MLGRIPGWVVVDAGGIDIQHLAPEHLFRRADVTDARQQFVKVIATTGALEPVVVQRESLYDVFPQALRGPDTKLDSTMRFDAVPDREDSSSSPSLKYFGRAQKSCERSYRIAHSSAFG